MIFCIALRSHVSQTIHYQFNVRWMTGAPTLQRSMSQKGNTPLGRLNPRRTFSLVCQAVLDLFAARQLPLRQYRAKSSPTLSARIIMN